MSEVLLFSGGLDSFPAWHFLGRPPALYFDLGHRYAAREKTAITALAAACGIQFDISTELRLGAWEAANAIIPMRNAHLAMLAAARGADTVWCVGVRGDHTLDKSPAAFADMSGFITRLSGRPVRVDSPFWTLTKTEIIAWYLAQGLPVEHLLLTFSCSRDDNQAIHCGRCPSCLRRWISLANNCVDDQFEQPPWTWERLESHYLPAMRAGRYPAHRARELDDALRTVQTGILSTGTTRSSTPQTGTSQTGNRPDSHQPGEVR